MSIRVLDPHGRPLTPVPPKKAVGKVDLGDAVWLHVDGVDPDPHHGTIVLTHPVDRPPAPRPLVQLFNADGQLLGWVSREVALHYVRREALRVVGHPPPGELHAVILPRPATPEALKEIRRIIARRAAERTLDRHTIRNEILRILREGGAWAEVEQAVEALATERLVSSTSASAAVEDLRRFARQLAALDLATASDLAVARTLALQGRSDRVQGPARLDSY
ncbi:hypothetical protein [Caldinitratiruptor microaerophilus]|uniref:hypothetical protein n=1 Tax=Caldinitratiruptor microaerophilus TaxID=671077 RepID=UPI0022301413|nr:hypothetical protein [Caldinitratiruptor microaerophilus]